METLEMKATTVPEQLAAPHLTSGGLLILVGVLLVAVILAAFAWGRRLKARAPAPPTPEEQPRLPEGGPVGDVVENREPDELPRTDERRTPHELKGDGSGSRRGS
ncbi:DUF6479 family protein [Streptomyces decoyicus]|uniref:DUF6479 family protein n=1 Tax=Streptomyces decoyicus TaxID=249567 RepID=UPI0034099736